MLKMRIRDGDRTWLVHNRMLLLTFLGWLSFHGAMAQQDIGFQHNCRSLGSFKVVFCGNMLNPSECIVDEWMCDGQEDCSTGFDESLATCSSNLIDPCDLNPCLEDETCQSVKRNDDSVAYHICTGSTQTTKSILTATPITTPKNTLPWWALTTLTGITRSTRVTRQTIGTSPVQLPTPDPLLCLPNPCMNGVCTPLLSGYHCACRPGYSGLECESGINPCGSEPCFNSGTCRNQDNTFQCSCRGGYSGRQCESEIDECASNPCQHGGSCRNDINAYTCTCTHTYTGSDCETYIRKCESNPCLDGGTCIDTDKGFICQCPETRAGRFCERKQNCNAEDGISDVCQNYGICYPLTSSTTSVVSCYCQPGFTGTFCETNNDDCVDNPCGENGKCIDGDNRVDCQCDTGWTGEVCESQINPCQPDPCRNGAHCCWRGRGGPCSPDLPPLSFECYCAAGFTGTLCQLIVNSCTSDPCDNGGMCTPIGSSFHCTCPLVYTGERCEVAVPCASEPCQHGGACVELEGGESYECQCQDGFSGEICQSTTPCESSPCQNGATCINAGEAFQCECTADFDGPTCETRLICKIDTCRNGGACDVVGGEAVCTCTASFTGPVCDTFIPCSSAPCANSGTCFNVGSGFYCNCPPQFEGEQCTERVICRSDTCQNGGTCVVVGTGYRCECPAQYEGFFCETLKVGPCSNSPCQNGGTCVRNGNSFFCQCPETHTGSRCENSLGSPCSPNPCSNNGLCLTSSDGGYTCSCTPAFTGDTCDTFLTCNIQPCQGGSNCTDLEGGRYRCDCPAGLQGTNCTTPSQCSPNPCENNGECQIEGTTFKCICPDVTYSGEYCQIYDPCRSFPCQHEAQCIITSNGYSCSCTARYTGTFCETELVCSNSPCRNGGTCNNLDSFPFFACECSEVWDGNTCEVSNQCGSSPCGNRGQCFNNGNDFVCACNPGLTGKTCEEEIFEACDSAPCEHDGTCFNSGEDFVCECITGYSGKTCNIIEPCTINPCENEAECFDNGEDFYCACLDGFSGKTCGTVDTCSSDTCINGYCRLTSQGLTCTCYQGYKGIACNIEEEPCDSATCENGGTCQNSGDTYTCSCPEAYTGSACETALLPCDRKPCQNGATCTNLGTGFYCSCPQDYFGTRCEYKEGICDENPCKNQGTCFETSTGFSCRCSPPWSGQLCDHEVSSCSESPCLNGGTCNLDSFGVYCVCPEGYRGLFCQLEAVGCTPNPCLNEGVCWQLDTDGYFYGCDCLVGFVGRQCQESLTRCTDTLCNGGDCIEGSSGRFQCTCPPQLIGDTCEIQNPCEGSPCENGGSCVVMDGKAVCYCPDTYSGSHCETRLPACSSDPCENGATCRDFGLTSSYDCLCATGFEGENCEVDVDDCSTDSLCLNGGKCIDQANGFSCECPLGFSGNNCGTVDSCTTQPCLNGGTCLSQPSLTFQTSFTCSCPKPYIGATCSEVNSCANQPCHNDGTCINEINHIYETPFTCECESPYSGPLCDFEASCNNQPCQNGGTCLNEPSLTFQTPFSCDCPAPYSGSTCEMIESCAEQPCRNGGTCVSEPNSEFEEIFTCVCVHPFSGPTCETNPSCASSPCFNGAACTNTPDGYRCDCMSSFMGPRCEDEIIGCKGITCSDHGACVEQGQFGYHCICQVGYSGSQCEVHACDSNPCLNGGQCHISTLPYGNGYFCECHAPNVGETCDHDVKHVKPYFDTDSFIQLPPPQGVTTSTTVSLLFRPHHPDGLMLYTGYPLTPRVSPDFLAIGLQNKYVIAYVDLGSGQLKLTSANQVDLFRWQRLSLHRTGQSVTLVVNMQTVQGMTPGSMSTLTIASVILVGGTTNTNAIIQDLGFTKGYHGCIHDVRLGGGRSVLVPWTTLKNNRGIQQCPSDPCDNNKCQNGASCQMLESDSTPPYLCMCPLQFTGTYCTEVVSSRNPPRFSGTGYLLTANLKPGSFMSIVTQILPTEDSGLILFTQLESDVLALYLNEKRVSMTFNVGYGAKVLTHPTRLVMGSQYTISLTVAGHVATLRLDDHEEVTDSAPGSNQTLTLGSTYYIGGVPDTMQVPMSVPVVVGFSGCILTMRAQQESVEWDSMMDGRNVERCAGLPCEQNECKNGATCKPDTSSAQGYTCTCTGIYSGTLCQYNVCNPNGENYCHNEGTCTVSEEDEPMCYCPQPYTGDRCQQVLTFSSLGMGRNSYLVYPGNLFIGNKYLGIYMRFKTSSPNGLLVWIGGRSSEYLMVGMRNGYMEMRIDMGFGMNVVSSVPRQFDDNRLYEIYIMQALEQLKLFIVDEYYNKYEYRSTALDSHLTLDLQHDDLYIGGHMYNIASLSGGVFNQGFTGCIIKLMGSLTSGPWENINLQTQVIRGAGVKICDSDICSVVPSSEACQNVASCYKDKDGISKCVCSIPYHGATCLEELKFTDASMEGHSYLAYDNIHFRSAGSEYMGIGMMVRTREPSGLLLMMGQVPGDYMMLGFSDGYLEFRLNLGTGMGIVTSAPTRMNNNQWFEVVILHGSFQMKMQITVEGETRFYPGNILNSDMTLDVNSNDLYIGGLPGNISELTGKTYQGGFIGCVKDLRGSQTAGIWSSYDIRYKALSGAGIEPCAHL